MLVIDVVHRHQTIGCFVLEKAFKLVLLQDPLGHASPIRLLVFCFSFLPASHRLLYLSPSSSFSSSSLPTCILFPPSLMLPDFPILALVPIYFWFSVGYVFTYENWEPGVSNKTEHNFCLSGFPLPHTI